MADTGTLSLLARFRRCSGCTWNPFTGDGERGCAWGECAYLPPELDVRCPECFFNFFTGEGNPACDPEECPHGADPRAAAREVRRWMGTALVG